jgi:hypothetical protein
MVRRFLEIDDHGERFEYDVPDEPDEVWTWLGGSDPPSEDVPLQHGRNACLHDVIHDWRWHDGVLVYYGHLADPIPADWLVLVYHVEGTSQACDECGHQLPTSARFCSQCGTEQCHRVI